MFKGLPDILVLCLEGDFGLDLVNNALTAKTLETLRDENTLLIEVRHEPLGARGGMLWLHSPQRSMP